jgi:hypothetical protein
VCAQKKKKSPSSKKSSPRPAPIITKGSATSKSGKKDDKKQKEDVKSARAPSSTRAPASTRNQKEPMPPAVQILNLFLWIVTLYRKYFRALNFQNFCQGIFSDDLLETMGGGISPGLSLSSPWMNDLLGPPSTTRSATRGGGLLSSMLLTNRSTPGSKGSGRTPKHLGEDNEPSRSASMQASGARGSGWAASTRSRAGAAGGSSSRQPNSGHVPNGGIGTFDLEFSSGTGLTPSMLAAGSPMLQTPTFGALDDMVGGFFGDEPQSTRGRRCFCLCRCEFCIRTRMCKGVRRWIPVDAECVIHKDLCRHAGKLQRAP